jgi:hypothetical protein
MHRIERTKSVNKTTARSSILEPSLRSSGSPTPHPAPSPTRTCLRSETLRPSAPGSTRAADSDPGRGFRPSAVSVQSQPDRSHPGGHQARGPSSPEAIKPGGDQARRRSPRIVAAFTCELWFNEQPEDGKPPATPARGRIRRSACRAIPEGNDPFNSVTPPLSGLLRLKTAADAISSPLSALL